MAAGLDSLQAVNNPSSQPEPGRSSGPEPVPDVIFDGRAAFAASYLAGNGLEIGGLHLALPVPPQARVRYVDRMSASDLRSEYPELASFDLVEVDVIDNGETLESVPADSQDFIVANHFLEHCEDPIGTIGTHLTKLRPGGVLFYAVPDKRYTFDHRRQVTELEHMVQDHREGPSRSRMDHYRQWVEFVDTGGRPADGYGPEQVEAEAGRLEAENYSIHMHVWTQVEFLQMVIKAREIHGEAFDIEAAAHRGIEFIVVLRKKGGPPPRPLADAPADSGAQRLPAPVRRIGRALPPSAQRSVRRLFARLGGR